MWMISHDKLISCTTGKASVRQGQWSVRVLSGPCPAYRFENLRGFHERSCQRTSRSLHKDLMVATDLKNIAACHVLNVSKVLPTAQSFCDLDVCNWQGFKHWHSALGSAVAWFFVLPQLFFFNHSWWNSIHHLDTCNQTVFLPIKSMPRCSAACFAMNVLRHKAAWFAGCFRNGKTERLCKHQD